MKKEIEGLSREINMEVVGELEYKNKEIGFYTFTVRSHQRCLQWEEGKWYWGTDVDLKIITEVKCELLFRAEK